MKLLLLIILLFSCVSTPEKPLQELPPGVQGEVFKYKTSHELLQRVTEKANCVLGLKEFQDEVKAIESFDYSNDNGKEVLEKLLSGSCTVSTYITKWYSPYKCSVLATTYTGDKEKFYINIRSCVYPRKEKSLLNTFFHECLHLLKYSHGDDSPAGKDNSVNYKIGSVAEKYYNNCP